MPAHQRTDWAINTENTLELLRRDQSCGRRIPIDSTQTQLATVVAALEGGGGGGPADDLVRCGDIAFMGDVWGQHAVGFDLRPFTGSTLHFIGCNSDGCLPQHFFCSFDASDDTLTFGAIESHLRVALDPQDVAGDAMPTEGGCATSASPDRISNFPVDGFAVESLCHALGYATGSVTPSTATNSCPQARSLAADGSAWGIVAEGPRAFAQSITCQ